MDKYDYDYKCVNGHDLCYGIGDPDCPYCEKIDTEEFIRSRDEILHECPTEGQQDTSEGD